MSDFITLTGIVATPPNTLTTGEGLAITSFRLASNQRKLDRSTGKWVDGDTNFYSVSTFRALATNVSVSVHKGDRVVVTGKIKVREWESGERRGVNVEVDADALGHDLSWGTASFSRNISSAPMDRSAFPSEADLAGTDARESEASASPSSGLLTAGAASASRGSIDEDSVPF
jgi:single-strand DNA-binding protein